MIANTVQLHRVLRATPEKIYRAFLDAEAMARWLPPNGFTAKVHHMDAKVGGTYKMSFTNFTTAVAILSAERISNSRPTNLFVTRASSMTQTWPEKCKRRLP